MKKRRVLLHLCITAYVIYTAPSFLTGVPLISWKALFLKQSSVEEITEESFEGEVEETPEVEYITIPNVPSQDWYLVDTSKRADALAKAFALATRPRVSARYTLVYSPHRPRHVTLLVGGIGEDNKEQPLVVRIKNVSFAIEEKHTPQIAMR